MKQLHLLLIGAALTAMTFFTIAPSIGGGSSAITKTIIRSVGGATTNDVTGTNTVVIVASPPGGNNDYTDATNATSIFSGQLIVSWYGNHIESVWGSVASGRHTNFSAFAFPSGINFIGDPLHMDTNFTSVAWYMNGGPTLWDSNLKSSDVSLDIANMNTYQSGTGINLDIVTNTASDGSPHVYSRNSAQLFYVPTNAASGQNKTNIFGGYVGMIQNYSGLNKGFLVGGPGTIAGDSTNRNRYGIGYLGTDKTFHIPIQMPSVSTPDDVNNVDLQKWDTVNTNTTIIGGFGVKLTQVVPNSGTAALNVTGTNGTSVITSDVLATNVNVGSTGNLGLARFFRFFASASANGGDPTTPAYSSAGGSGIYFGFFGGENFSGISAGAANAGKFGANWTRLPADVDVSSNLMTSILTLTNSMTIQTTNIAPVNAVTPVLWITITNSGNAYRVPLYQ